MSDGATTARRDDAADAAPRPGGPHAPSTSSGPPPSGPPSSGPPPSGLSAHGVATRIRRALRRTAPVAVAVLVVLAGWQIAVSVSGVRPQVLPSPWRVLTQGVDQRATLAMHAWSTLSVTVVGFACSVVFAFAAALVLDALPAVRRAVVPLFVVSQTIPVPAIAPLMIIWFGFGALPKILVVVLVTFFPIAIGVIEGLAATDRDAQRLVRSMGATWWQSFRMLRLPGSLPRVFTALRIAVTYAVVGAVFAEYVGARTGLGIYMAMQKNAFRTDLVLAAVAVTSVATLLLFGLTVLVERLVAPWARDTRGRDVR